MRKLTLLFSVLLLAATSVGHAQTSFNGVDEWRGALTASDPVSLKAIYSTNPPARYLEGHNPKNDISPEIEFWQKLFSTGISNVEVSQTGEGEQQGLHLTTVSVSFHMKTPNGERTRYVVEDQAWQQQGGAWRVVLARHTNVLKMKQPTKLDKNLYPKNADAKAEIKEAVAKAAKEHKRVILVFGGNWCYDCHVLDLAFHQPDVQPIVDKNFEVVHVDIGGEEKKNEDVIAQYKIPIDKGVPSLAVLESDGKLLYSQQNGEWESFRSLDPDDVISFLNKWKP